ncbi:unnamed protein product [Phytophthora fragariaefolia]|uniref:Unnamed protein product n=1 Tax=Phytophthora fragariaefolia TaxID=1490495 RepID=A0A9W7D1N3_9STRA|nr:unnamed protein product [Phytophthora fragariaefolia]
MEIVVLGCGTSSSVPSVRCLLTRDCKVCGEAQANPDSKNRRLNPSLLIRNLQTNTNVLVDCGKTFREAVLRIFPRIGVSAVHSVLLTHDHADACLGLDDLKEVLPVVDPVAEESYQIPPEPMKVHCNSDTSRSLRTRFPHLIEEPPPMLTESCLTKESLHWATKLELDVFKPWERFEAGGMEFLSLPVIHGAKYTSIGFEFGYELGVRVVYISDVSEFLEETRAYLNDACKPRIDVVIIDALYIVRHHNTPMSLLEVIERIKTIRPRVTLLTGMSHEFDFYAHSDVVAEMGEETGLRVAMAYDAMRLMFP